MYCQHCGAQNGPDAAFCTKCGTRLEHDANPIASDNLEDALLETINILGADALPDAGRLHAGLADICDHRMKEYLVFMRSCDADYLSLFERPLQTRATSDFKRAASLAEDYLHGQKAEDAVMAQRVSRATAQALATHCNAGRLHWTQTKARPVYPSLSSTQESTHTPAPAPTTTPSPVSTPAPATYNASQQPASTPPANNYGTYTATPTRHSGGASFGITVGIIVALGIVIGVLFATGILLPNGSAFNRSEGTHIGSDASSGNGSALSQDTLPRNWDGWYYGFTSQTASKTTKRACTIQLTSVSTDGSLEGICFVSKHAESVNDIHCSYNVRGSIDWQTGEITLNGTEWVDKGNSEGWGDFEGYVSGTDLSSIEGTWYSASDHSTNGDWHMESI